MSKNNSPQTRPSSVRRRRPTPQAPAPAPTVKARQSRLRRLLPAVLIPHGIAALLVVVVAVAVLMFSDTSMVALPATIAQLWLALNMSPVSGSGEVIGVIPMVPAMVLVWAVARRVHNSVKKRVSMADLGVLTILVLAAPLTLTGIASAMLYDASAVLDVGIPPVPVMLGRVLLLHLIALGLGMGPRLWRALARRYRAPEWLVPAATLALRFLRIYAVVALVVVLVRIMVNHQVFVGTLTGYEDGSAVPALILMSLLYLPNVVISAMGVMVGAPLYFGEGSISLFSVVLVPLPPLPVLAAIPATAPQWAVGLLLIPAAVTVWVSLKTPIRLVATLAAAVLGGLFFLLLAVLAGGILGVYGYVGLHLLPAAGLIIGYLAVVGLLIAGIDRVRAGLRAPAAGAAGATAIALVDDSPAPDPDSQETGLQEDDATGESVENPADDIEDADGTDDIDDIRDTEPVEDEAVYMEPDTTPVAEDGDVPEEAPEEGPETDPEEGSDPAPGPEGIDESTPETIVGETDDDPRDHGR